MSRALPIFLLTDFGEGGFFPGAMKAVIAARVPDGPVHDLAHGVTPGRVREGAAILESVTPYLPERCIVCAVVDPGVGSERRALVVQVEGRLAVGPDNGLLHPWLTRPGGAEVRACERLDLAAGPVSSTFHGRDLFAPWCAFLAAGGAPADLGPRIFDPCLLFGYEPRLEGAERVGEVVMIDPFGNLITNLHRRHFDAELLRSEVLIAGHRLRLVPTFGSVAPGELLAYIGSSDHVEVAVRDGSAAERLLAAQGTEVRLRFPL